MRIAKTHAEKSKLTGTSMGARRIFSRGGQIRGSGTSPPAGFRGGAPVTVRGRSLPKPTTDCENNALIIHWLSVLL